MRVAARCVTPYALTLAACAVLPYGDLRAIATVHRAPYRLLGRGAATVHAAPYALVDVQRHARQCRTPWALLADRALVPVANTPELLHDGRTHRVESADLSCDEDSPVWLARIRLADVESHAAIRLLDAVTLVLGMETFSLVVDGKSVSRPEVVDVALEITAVSPLALADAPWAAPVTVTHAQAVPARALVEQLIGPVDWRLPAWIVPAGRAAFDRATPLSIARAVVGAAGGLIESAPDGSVICRPRHPVHVPDYDTTAPAVILTDGDVFSVTETVAPRSLVDRVTVSNETATGGPEDRLEYEADEDDTTRGTVRAWPWPMRGVSLVHTGHPATAIVDLGVVTWEVVEVVEFVDGSATARWPVAAWLGAEWMRADLGAVRAERTRLTAGVAGYSLARVRYATAAREWSVSLTAAAEEVQFVLMDEEA
ncbi:MAG: hypothetical protein H3C26_07340 [Rhodocyclaceae bacterium]|nr:hypothetical protein [Rhodocyclaceae bacterium]